MRCPATGATPSVASRIPTTLNRFIESLLVPDGCREGRQALFRIRNLRAHPARRDGHEPGERLLRRARIPHLLLHEPELIGNSGVTRIRLRGLPERRLGF